MTHARITPAALRALGALFVLVGLALALAVAVAAQASAQADPPRGYYSGNVYTAQDTTEIAERFDLAADIGLDGVRLNTGLGGYLQVNRKMPWVAEAARRRGLRFVIHPNDGFGREEPLAPADVLEGGRAWGAWCAANRDVCSGFVADNETALLLEDLYRNRGETGARAALATIVSLQSSFAAGVKGSCPTCPVFVAGLAGRDLDRGGALTEEYLRALWPHRALYDGFDAHHYRTSAELVAADGTVRWDEDPAGLVYRATDAAGWPRLPLLSFEFNVRQNTFDDPVRAAAGFEAMARRMLATGYVVLGPFSPFHHVNDPDNPYTIRPGTELYSRLQALTAEDDAPPPPPRYALEVYTTRRCRDTVTGRYAPMQYCEPELALPEGR